jgi:hypothetical protein
MSSKWKLTGIVSKTKGTLIIVYALEKEINGKHSQKARSYGRATVKRHNA